MNPRQLQLMMKRLGMTNEPLADVEEVIIRLKEKEHVLRQPEVSILTVQGVRTYQVVGESEIRARTSSGVASPPVAAPALSTPAPPPGPPEEDVTLVMEQTGADRAAALEALQESDGAPAEAILKLLARRGGGG